MICNLWAGKLIAQWPDCRRHGRKPTLVHSRVPFWNSCQIQSALGRRQRSSGIGCQVAEISSDAMARNTEYKRVANREPTVVVRCHMERSIGPAISRSLCRYWLFESPRAYAAVASFVQSMATRWIRGVGPSWKLL